MDQCLRVAWVPGMEAIAKESNFLSSPMSLRAGLALLAAGTNGATLRQLLTFLGSEDAHHLAVATARLLADVNTWPQLSFAASVFVDRTLHLTPEFGSAATSATAWRLTNVLTRDMVGPTTKLVLANGLHFKATWARKFEPSDTVRRHFFGHDDGSRPVRVPFLSAAGMQYAERFDAIGHGFKVLQCFYKMVGRDGKLDLGSPCFCMLVFLPYDRRDGLARLLRMAVAQPDFVMRCAPRREQLVSPCMVPKFRFFSRLEAVSALCQLGLTEPFDKGVADLSRMVSNVPPEGLYVSTVTQTCAVEVDEGGTTAVAAMYAASSPTYSLKERLPRPPPMSFVADHPFMFAIVEYERAEVLFHGHVMDPSKED
nr:unnamed protein product [Digitaria exilis]